MLLLFLFSSIIVHAILYNEPMNVHAHVCVSVFVMEALIITLSHCFYSLVPSRTF